MAKPPPRRTAFKKGSENPGSRARRKETGAGRKKGTPNKITSDIKSHILNAINDLPGQLSGEGWFRDLAKRDKRSMAALLGKCIPAKIEPALDPDETAQKIRERMRAMNNLTASPSAAPATPAATPAKPKEKK
jgi:hypothetical protein